MAFPTIRRLAKQTLTLSGKILLFLIEQGDDLLFEMNNPALCSLMDIDDAKRYLHRKYTYLPRPIRRLTKNNLIEIRRKGNTILIKLTKDGKIAATQLKIARHKQRLGRGNELIIIFDIPESVSNVRKAFRQSLKRMGFYRIQFSVWGTRKNIIVPLREYLTLLRIDKWVSMYISKQIT